MPISEESEAYCVFDTYQDIFNARGDAYHQGMLEQPLARRQEFDAILSLARPTGGQVLCDMPSGGGYLHSFIDADVKLICVDTSRAFADKVPQSQNVRAVLCDLNQVPVDGGTVDTIICLAGLHHVANRPAVFAEMRRLLKRGTGRACIADVEKGSPVDPFLNDFVHRHNTMGHQGEFIDANVRSELINAGFRILSDQPRRFHWTSDSEAGLARFCRLLFGLDRADEQQTLDGIQRYVGYEHADGQWRMNWELTFIEAITR